MEDNKVVATYKKNNVNKKHKIVFQLTERGFASEINNMISAILYCLVHEIEFVLYSKTWTATYRKGWQDYFLPFCKENSNIIFYRKSVFSITRKQNLIICSREKILSLLRKMLYKNNLCAYEIWDDMRSNNFQDTKFTIPDLGIRGDIFHAKQVLLKMIYHHNHEIQEIIRSQDNILDDIRPYIAVHIRRGDKVSLGTKEADRIEVSKYIEKIKIINPDITNIFIATDDYRVVVEFKSICPSQWFITTFCPPRQLGYDQGLFNHKSQDQKRQDMIRLFTDIYFFEKAEYFIGTYSSNMGRLVALFKGKEKCHSLDLVEWHGL